MKKREQIIGKFKKGKVGLVCAGRCIVKDPRRGTQAHLFGVKTGWRIFRIDSTTIPERVSTELIGECISRVQNRKKEFEIEFTINYMETLSSKERKSVLGCRIIEVRMMNGQFEGQWIPGKIVKQNKEHGIYDVLISEDLPEHLSDYAGILVPNVPIECVRPHRPARRKRSKKPSPFARFGDDMNDDDGKNKNDLQDMSKELEKIKVEMKDRKYAERLQRNQEKRECVRAESISHERAKWMKDEELSKCPYVVFV